jgi:hypothetical protein
VSLSEYFLTDRADSDPYFAGQHPLQCPACGRTGTVRTAHYRRVAVGHTCPGPWVFEGKIPARFPSYRLVFHSKEAIALMTALHPDRRGDEQD